MTSISLLKKIISQFRLKVSIST